MVWQLDYARRAIRDLRAIPENDRATTNMRLRAAARDPGRADLRKLAGSDREWRLRVGRERVIIELDNDTGMVTVLRILPRDRAYR